MARSMLAPLDAWLSGLSTAERKGLMRTCELGGLSPIMTGLLAAIRFEVQADLRHEKDVIDGLEVALNLDADGGYWPDGR